MKRLLILFGVLDILTLIRDFTIKTSLIGISWGFGIQLMHAARGIMLCSLLVSAYFLIRGNRIGFWITYCQFPPRVFFALYSFNFLITILDRMLWGEFYVPLMWGLLFLEIVRLGITIRVHRMS